MKSRLLTSMIRRKRGILLFSGAFVLPLLFVVGISLDTFSKRHKTNRNLLESNLWYSGRSALVQFESSFAELEDSLLNTAYITNIASGDLRPDDIRETGLFVLDEQFSLVYPETGDDNAMLYLTGTIAWEPEFKKLMDRADIDGVNHNHQLAISKYLQAFEAAGTLRQKAMAIEGLARTYMAAGNFRQAINQYRILAKDYSSVVNLSGHPFGVSAPLQLYTIGQKTGEEVSPGDSLMKIYQKIKDGFWPLNESSWLFFLSEYEAILGSETISVPAPYGNVLELAGFLKEQVIPRLQENLRIPGYTDTNEPRRFLIYRDEVPFLVSCRKILTAPPGNQYLAGVCLNLESLRAGRVPQWIDRVAEETKLNISLLDENQNDIFNNNNAVIPEGSLLLPFSNIPLPWTMMAVQPGFEKLEKDRKVQIVIFGILLLFIIILMVLGVTLLLRDINRETESMLLRTEFVHNVSHELKTPLSLIRLYGETLMIRKNLAENDRTDALQIITKESERLSYMINNILDFSKMEMGRKEFDIKEDDLVEVVSSTLDSYNYHLEKKGFKIVREIDGNIPHQHFDRNALEGILINLLGNSIKFSPGERWVGIRLFRDENMIWLEVEDHGSGIPADDMPFIFDRFYRSKHKQFEQERGSGLGLTIVKHAVEAHGWDIRVKSKIGTGTIFSISIPEGSGGG